MITIIGLGVRPGDLTARAADALRVSPRVFLRTEKHASSRVLCEMNIAYTAFDALYEDAEDFDELYGEIAKTVVNAREAAFCVPGSAARGDTSVRALVNACEASGIDWQIIPGVGWEALAAAWGGGVENLTAITARAIGVIDPRRALAVTEIDTRTTAGKLKLALMEHYPDAHAVYLDGRSMPLYELDRAKAYSIDTALFVPPLAFGDAERYDYRHLLEVMRLLRDPANGCPWDREQTHSSLAKYLIEEAYEVRDAIEKDDPAMICDELGDVLLQIAFHSAIASEHGTFTDMDITSAICQKMISRHTHIFGSERADTAAEVSVNWAEIKKKEKGLSTIAETLAEVPRGFPAWLRAEKILKRLRTIDFDFAALLRNALDAQSQSEAGLHDALDELILRVSSIESDLKRNGKSFEKLTENELSALWKSAKVP